MSILISVHAAAPSALTPDSARLSLRLGLVALVLAVSGFRPVSTDVLEGQQVAIEGFDPVAYFTQGEAVQGSPLIAYRWREAWWYFSRPANRRLFREDPLKYAPAYGGYCALCVSMTAKVETSGNPRHFFVHNERLYLLQTAELLAQWQAAPDTYTAEADRVYDQMLAEYRKLKEAAEAGEDARGD